MREYNSLIRVARSQAIEWSLAIDQMVQAIIAEYFAEDEMKRGLLAHEVLPMLTSSQKIQVMATLETEKGISYGKQYSRLIRQLSLLNSYRNLMVHEIPTTLDRPRMSMWRGKMNPYPISKRIINKMETTSEIAFDMLGNLLERLVRRRKWSTFF